MRSRFPADEPTVNLQPGEIYVARRASVLQTLLGSCVSATFWSEHLGVGGMCHGVLPRCPPSLSMRDSNLAEGARYVDFSIRYLAQQFESLGAVKRDVEVKLFGGGDVLPGAVRIGRLSVGEQNRAVALQVLHEEGFSICASDLGGDRGRTIFFHTRTGEVFVRRLGKLMSLLKPQEFAS